MGPELRAAGVHGHGHAGELAAEPRSAAAMGRAEPTQGLGRPRSSATAPRHLRLTNVLFRAFQAAAHDRGSVRLPALSRHPAED